MKFACVPVQYAPKRKFINFSLPKWRQKLAEFEHPDVASWVNNLYQTKVYPTPKEFNEAYDQAISLGVMPSEMVCWRHKPMILTKTDVENFEEEFTEGAFNDVHASAAKFLARAKTVLEKGEKVIFVY
jgi:hypothetical protein